MSLKAFHIVFVILTVLTSLFVGGVYVHRFMNLGGWQNLASSGAALAAAIALVIYGRYVLRKLKHFSYL